MSDFSTLEQQLEQLGRELGGDAQHTADVVRRAVSSASKANQVATRRKRRPMRWQMPAALAACVAVCVGFWWLSRPATLYARMLAALANARTVHATGWTRQIVRKWPLEKPTAAPGDETENKRYDMEAWYWTAPDGTTHSYERQGPVIVTRRGGEMKEYQEDADLTFIYEGGYSKDRVAEFGQLAAYLSALQRPSLTKEELGRRLEEGRWVRGIRHIEGDRVQDIWIDEQASLPVRISTQRRASGEQVMELAFTINEPVPGQIMSYEPPQTKYVRRDGGSGVNDQWRQHVAEIVNRLETEPISGRIAILPREDGRTFANQWSLLTPDGKYWVRPLDVSQYNPMTPSYFIDRHLAPLDGGRGYGTWRLAKELHDIEWPRADLVHEADVLWEEWARFALNEFGLEFVDQVENRTFWIAKHDGRQLKPWQEVKPPVPYIVEGGVQKKGRVKPGIGFALRPTTMKQLFEDFNQMIDRNDLSADKPWIIDETGLPAPPPYDESIHGTYKQYSEKIKPEFYVATDSPWFVGHESIQMARDWYKKEFGVTFQEEIRPVTVHVIRHKK
jgi:hypothetical protein